MKVQKSEQISVCCRILRNKLCVAEKRRIQVLYKNRFLFNEILVQDVFSVVVVVVVMVVELRIGSYLQLVWWKC